MKLLGLKTPRVRRLLGSGVSLAAFWASGVLLLETVGRGFESDTLDLFGIAILVAYLVATWIWHLHRPLGVLAQLSIWVRRRLHSLWDSVPEFGADFRERPPIPAAHPRPFARIAAVFAALAVALACAAPHLPSGLRALVAPISYTLWIALLSGLWLLLLGGTIAMIFYPAAVIHDAWLTSRAERAGRGGRGALPSKWTLIGGYLSVLLLAALLLDAWPWIPAAGALLLFCLDAVLLYLPGNSRVTMLWKAQGEDGEMRSLGAHQAMCLQMGLLALLVVDIGLLARGESFGIGFGQPADASTPVTALFGRLFLWCAFGGMCVGTGQIVRFVRRSRSLGAGALPAPTLFVHDAADPAERSRMRRRLGAAGWRVRFAPEGREPADVEVRIAPSVQEDELQLFETWPLPVTADEVGEPGFLSRIARRDELKKRRALARGIQRLFKRAAATDFPTGNGYWLGPQHWFLPGMSRDSEGEEPEGEARPVLEKIVGPPYHLLFSPAVRRYFRDVTRALEIDLVFVEDGVPFRRFRRVLTVMFETYDIHGGRQPIEEKHFVGLTGVRVILHELGPGEPFRSESYPEPDYEDIARARILHVFKDRGGDEEEVRVPDSFTDLPVPMLMG